MDTITITINDDGTFTVAGETVSSVDEVLGLVQQALGGEAPDPKKEWDAVAAERREEMME